MRPVSRLLVISLLLVPSLARAGDPLNEVSGIEDWYTPRQVRRPVKTQHAIRLQAEYDQAVDELRADRNRLTEEQAEFVADFEALERARRRRARGGSQAKPRQPESVEQWLADEQRRLERAAEKALSERSAEPARPAASAADAAFDAPPRVEKAKPGAAASRADEAFDDAAPAAIRSQAREPSAAPVHATQESVERQPPEPSRGEPPQPGPAAWQAELRAAERAEAERLAREQEAARRIGGRLDADGQFVDPDLESP